MIFSKIHLGRPLFMKAWIEKKIYESNDAFRFVKCPFLLHSRCTIYVSRPNCCKNYPQKIGFCSKANCKLLKGIKSKKVKNNSNLSSKICSECHNICCEAIMVPKKAKITKQFIRKWMDIDCKNCRNIF